MSSCSHCNSFELLQMEGSRQGTPAVALGAFVLLTPTLACCTVVMHDVHSALQSLPWSAPVTTGHHGEEN